MTTYSLHLFFALALGIGAVIWMVLKAERQERSEAARVSGNSHSISVQTAKDNNDI